MKARISSFIAVMSCTDGAGPPPFLPRPPCTPVATMGQARCHPATQQNFLHSLRLSQRAFLNVIFSTCFQSRSLFRSAVAVQLLSRSNLSRSSLTVSTSSTTVSRFLVSFKVQQLSPCNFVLRSQHLLCIVIIYVRLHIQQPSTNQFQIHV